VGALKIGNGMEPGVTQGPLINAAAVAKVEGLVADALAKGAKAVCGGRRVEGAGTFYQPTILTGATPAMEIFAEEIFGPVAVLYRFKTEAEAIALANATRFGLAAYFYARDVGRVFRVAEALEYGIVGINEGIISTAEAPFGGVKESGLGREGSKYGIEDFLVIKYLCLGGIAG
jgi:succinate-semialdehyde dehydrogenase/glutarate-semialdehyde dehydrogenase